MHSKDQYALLKYVAKLVGRTEIQALVERLDVDLEHQHFVAQIEEGGGVPRSATKVRGWLRSPTSACTCTRSPDVAPITLLRATTP